MNELIIEFLRRVVGQSHDQVTKVFLHFM